MPSAEQIIVILSHSVVWHLSLRVYCPNPNFISFSTSTKAQNMRTREFLQHLGAIRVVNTFCQNSEKHFWQS